MKLQPLLYGKNYRQCKEIHRNTLTIRDYKIPFSVKNRSGGQKEEKKDSTKLIK